jgi:hypothetical protein
VDVAVEKFFAQIRPIVMRFAFDERLRGGAKAHESFDGILAEHALVLEEVRDLLREDTWQSRIDAQLKLKQEIDHVRALGSIAQKEEKDAHEA